jgi:glycerophosphoryl diester phosphodiesterase
MEARNSGSHDFYRDRPLNFAHRGASHEAPENTLAAFLLALELDADGIEFDVQLSRDDQAVVIHDYDLSRTTNGQGLVRERTLEELQQLDAGSHFDPAFVEQRIPTLQEVIDIVRDRLLLNVELKSEHSRDGTLASVVARTLEDNDLLDTVIVSSFEPLLLRRMKQLNPRLRTGFLYAPDSPRLFRRPWLRYLIRFDALHPYYAAVDERTMRWARNKGYRVNVWTVDEPATMRRLVQAGVDGIITNRPDLLREVLGEAQEGRRAPDHVLDATMPTEG